MLLGLLRALSEAPRRRRLGAAGNAGRASRSIKSFETFRAKLHNDAHGHCAIGSGTRLHTGRCDGRPIEEPYQDGVSDDQARELLDSGRLDRGAVLRERLRRSPPTQHQYVTPW